MERRCLITRRIPGGLIAVFLLSLLSSWLLLRVEGKIYAIGGRLLSYAKNLGVNEAYRTEPCRDSEY